MSCPTGCRGTIFKCICLEKIKQAGKSVENFEGQPQDCDFFLEIGQSQLLKYIESLGKWCVFTKQDILDMGLEFPLCFFILEGEQQCMIYCIEEEDYGCLPARKLRDICNMIDGDKIFDCCTQTFFTLRDDKWTVDCEVTGVTGPTGPKGCTGPIGPTGPPGPQIQFKTTIVPSQNVASNASLSPVLFNVPTFNVGGGFAANVFTVPVGGAGFYHFNVLSSWTLLSGSTLFGSLDILVNGSLGDTDIHHNTAVVTQGFGFGVDLQLSDGDVVSIQFRNNIMSSGTVSGNTGGFFSGHLYAQ